MIKKKECKNKLEVFDGSEAELGRSFGRQSRVEKLDANEVGLVEVLDGLPVAGLDDVEEDVAPVIDQVKVLWLNFELLVCDPEALV